MSDDFTSLIPDLLAASSDSDVGNPAPSAVPDNPPAPTDNSAPLSVRNNNPGNLRPAGADSGFQTFDTPEAGVNAMQQDLHAKITGNSSAMKARYGADYTPTISNLISTWAPSSENNTSAYVNDVAGQLGKKPDDVLTPDDIPALTQAMIAHEGGKKAADYFGGGKQYAQADTGTQTDAMPDIDSSANNFDLASDLYGQPAAAQNHFDLADDLYGQDKVAPQNPGFIDRESTDLSNRQQQIEQAGSAYRSGDKSMGRAALDMAGSYAGGIGDTASNVAGSAARLANHLVPQSVDDYLGANAKDAANYLGNTKLAQAAKEDAQYAKENYPNAYGVAKDVGSIASVLPIGKGAEAAADVTGNLLSDTGQALVKSGENSAANQQAAFAKGLVMPKQTKAVLEDQVDRTTQQGLLNKKVVEPTPQEQAAINEVAQTPGVKSGNSYQANHNVIQAAKDKEAQALSGKLKDSGIIYNQSEMGTKLDDVLSGLKEEPFIAGSGEPAATAVVNKMQTLVNNNPGTPSGLLRARQQFDAWAKSRKGSVFDNNQNAFSTAVSSTRQAANDFLSNMVPDAEVKASLQKQSNLYRAMDNIAPKAAGEASNRVSRAVQKAANILPVKGVLAKAAIAAPVLGAAAVAPALTAGAAGLYGTGRVLASPTTRKIVGTALDKTGQLLGHAKGGLIKDAPTHPLFTHRQWTRYLQSGGKANGHTLKDKNSPAAQKKAYETTSKAHSAALKKSLGRDATAREVELAHYVTPQGVVRVLKQKNGTMPAHKMFPANVVKDMRKLFFNKNKPYSVDAIKKVLGRSHLYT